MNGGEVAPNEPTFQWNALLYRFHGGPLSPPQPGTVPLPPGVRAIHGKDTGRRYLFRPAEVLCREEDLRKYPRLEEALTARDARRWSPSDYATYGWGASANDHAPEMQVVATAKVQDRQLRADEAVSRAGVARFVVPPLRSPDPPIDVPRYIEELRREGEEKWNEKWPVHPHIVMAGELGSGSFGPAEPPERVPDGPVVEVPSHLGEGIRVGVVDTGAWKSHELLYGHCRTRGPEDDEELDENGDDRLDYEAGHGTFVAGIIRQYAPAAEVICRGTLDSMGIIDDATLAGTLYSLLGEHLDVLNLSLGGYTFASEPTGLPTTIAALRALRDENPRLVIVAAAGNHNRAERFYPAAWPDVVGVGALDRNFSKALFSNFGDWVDVWAPGVRLLSSYLGKDVHQPGGGSTDAWARWTGTSFATPVVAGKITGNMRRRRRSV